ncbi:MAG: DUF1667 domain-containing protein [Bacillota bacterium]
MSKTFTCIVCPRGCRISVDDDMNITGNKCVRGENYVKTELKNPTRILTTTVKTVFDDMPRVSVKTAEAIPKGLIMEAMKEINKITIDKRLKIGDVIIKDILDTGVNIILTKSLNLKEQIN